MKNFNNKLVSLLCLVVAGATLVGCGSGDGGGGVDKKAQQEKVALVTNMRSYFDKAGGDYAKLSDADKAAFVKLCGGEAKAEANWKLMKEGPAGAPRGSSAPPAGN